MSSFEIYHPKNINHNQDGNHNDNKVWITIFFLKCQKMTAKIFLAGMVHIGLRICVFYKKEDFFLHFYLQRGNAASIRGTFPDSAILSEIFVL
jgi:hypothetical protein